MFRRLGALEKLFLFARSSPPPPPVRMRWNSFSASWPPGLSPAENSLVLNVHWARFALRGGIRSGTLTGLPSARVCRSVGKAFSCNQFKISSYKWFRANSRAINTSGIRGFKPTGMNTCGKMSRGNGCLSVFSLEQAPHLNAVITRSPRRRGPLHASPLRVKGWWRPRDLLLCGMAQITTWQQLWPKSRKISTSKIKDFKAPEMNTCTKICGGVQESQRACKLLAS
jgi:hypothetical protein